MFQYKLFRLDYANVVKIALTFLKILKLIFKNLQSKYLVFDKNTWLNVWQKTRFSTSLLLTE